ncbi:hypothetical protein BDQ17DRAFT_617601 [Cyathus striatus]|nr:hypothetical protein BDQ17DRAFT_617601 [Cyathus striatus]
MLLAHLIFQTVSSVLRFPRAFSSPYSSYLSPPVLGVLSLRCCSLRSKQCFLLSLPVDAFLLTSRLPSPPVLGVLSLQAVLPSSKVSRAHSSPPVSYTHELLATYRYARANPPHTLRSSVQSWRWPIFNTTTF